MISTHSDKLLLEQAINGSREAASMLIKRYGYKVDDVPAVMHGLKSLKVLSVSAAKRIISANASNA